MNWDWKQIVLVIILLVVLVLLRHIGRRHGQETRATRLMKQYAIMTREKLEAAPEGELLDAVISRVLAQSAESRRPDPVETLSHMEHGPAVVYCLWAVCKEMAAGDYAALLRTPTREMAPLAAENFRAVGAPACGEAWQALTQAAKEDIPAAEETFRRAVERECPLALCESYIRDNAEEFIDTDASDKAQA